MDTEFVYNNGLDKAPTSLVLGPKDLATIFYQYSPPEVSMYQLSTNYFSTKIKL